jgi:hypothetical protein
MILLETTTPQSFWQVNSLISVNFQISLIEAIAYTMISSRTFKFAGAPLSILLVNTAWMSTGGIGREDRGNLLVPEKSLHQAIKSAGIGKKILVGHHPISWLADHSAFDVQTLIDQEINIYLHGHMHKADPRATQAALGKTYLNQSGALFTSRKMWNGSSIVSLSLSSDHIQTLFRSYFDDRRAFGVGEDIIHGGTYYSSESARWFWHNHPERISYELLDRWVNAKVLDALREEFAFRIYDKPLASVFVEPTLSTIPNTRNATLAEKRKGITTIDTVISSSANYLLSSSREFGRTTCLKYLALRTAETCRADKLQVPVYINFDEVKVGPRRLIQAIRGALPELPENITIELLLELGLLEILIDDVNPERERNFKQLAEFLTRYPDNKYIVCLQAQFQELLADLTPEFPVPFTKIFIQPFSRNQVRTLVEKWTGHEQDKTEQLLNRIVTDIVQINVPVTAVTCSIFLTILDKNTDFKPINRAVVVQQYVDVLLGRYAPDEAYRDTFDATNKAHYLAYVASKMVMADSYSVSRDELRTITVAYMTEFGFDRKADEIVELFLHARVFADGENGIHFRFRAFLEYFIALRMEDDRRFYDFVMIEERYLKFLNEIEYYSGVTRDDAALLDLIGRRFEELNERVKRAGEWTPDLKLFEKFKVRKDSNASIAGDVERSLSLPRLSDKERDELLDGEIPRDTGSRQQVFRTVFQHDESRWLACLMLYSRVVRNSELVRAEDKRKGVFVALRGWSDVSVRVMALAPRLAKDRKIRINGVTYVASSTEEEPDDDKLLIRLFYAIPENVSRLIFQHLGSEKLSRTLAAPLSDGGEGEGELLIITFFRKLLIADLKLPSFPDSLRKLCEELGSAVFLRAAFETSFHVSRSYSTRARDVASCPSSATSQSPAEFRL